MPFNGSGTFVPLSAPTYPAVAGEVIMAARFNSVLQDVFDGLSGVVTRNGESPWTAAMPAGGFKLTGLAAGTTSGDALMFGQSGASLAGLTLTNALSGTSATLSGAFSGTSGTFSTTLAVTGVATFTAQSVHSNGISITAGGLTVTAGGLTVSAGTVTLPATTSIGLVSATELSYLDGVTSPIQTQLDAKLVSTDSALKGRWRLITSTPLSAATAVSFTNLDTTYDMFCIEIVNLTHTSNTTLGVRTSTNNGSSYDSGATDYNYNYTYTDGVSVAGLSSSGATSVLVTPGADTTSANGGHNLYLYIAQPFTARRTRMYWHGDITFSTGTANRPIHGAGSRLATAGLVNAVQLFPTSGTMSGTVNLYGRTK